MNKLQAIEKAKEFRKRADELLQEMKGHTKQLREAVRDPQTDKELIDSGEVIAQHILSTRDLESCIMRQGMALKYIGNPEPYPASKITVEDIARFMWEAFGTHFYQRAEPMNDAERKQKWDEFCAEPMNAKAVQGWLAAASVHPALHRVEPTSGGLKM